MMPIYLIWVEKFLLQL